MGISGLLPVFKSITKPVHIREYSGKRAAVDIYSWLHKGAFGCSKDLIDGTPTDRYIDYCMYRVDLLRHHQIIPVLVFDGGLLPMKANQESKRQRERLIALQGPGYRSRKDFLTRAVEHERQGNQTAAYECYQKAVDITPAIALRLIQVLKEKSVEFIVAPYEADAQMAFLARNEYVHIVITEDSDMIAYRCPRVLYKMDKFGQGMEIEYKDIVKSKELNFSNFTDDMLLEMCVLSGCDYLSSLPGLGVKKAHNLVRRLKSYRKVIQSLCFNGVSVPKEYEDTFRKALLTFKHQRVYDPEKQQVVYLSDPEGMDLSQDHDFVGPDVAPHLARAIAEGEVNPITLEPFLEEEQKGSQSVKSAQVSPVVRFPISQTAAPKVMSRHMSGQKNKLASYFIPVSIAARKDFKPPKRTGELEKLEKPVKPFPFPQDTPDSQEATPPPMTPRDADSPITPIASASGKASAAQGKRKQMKEDVQWIPGSPEVSSLSPCLSRLESCNGGSSPRLHKWQITESDCCSSEESGSLNGDWSFDIDVDSVLVGPKHGKSGDSWTEGSSGGEEFWDGDPLFSKKTSRNRKLRHQAAKGLDMDFCEKKSKRSKSISFDEALAELDFSSKKKVSPQLDFDQFAFGAPSKSHEAEGTAFTDSDSGTPFSDFEQRGVKSVFLSPPSPTSPSNFTIRNGSKGRPTESQQDPFSNSECRSQYFGAATPLTTKKSRFATPLSHSGWSSETPELDSSPDSPLPRPCWTSRDRKQGTASPRVDDAEIHICHLCGRIACCAESQNCKRLWLKGLAAFYAEAALHTESRQDFLNEADEVPSTKECLNEQGDASGDSLESSPERTRVEERRPYLDEISKQSFATNVAHLPHYSFTGHHVVHRVASSLHKSTKNNFRSSVL